MERLCRTTWAPSTVDNTLLEADKDRLRGQKQSKNIATLENNGKKIDDDGEKAELFANRLKVIFSDENQERFDKETKKKVDEFHEQNKIEDIYTQSEKRPKLFTMRDLCRALKALNNKTSTDHEGISNKLLKNLSYIAKEKLLTVFNLC